MSVDPYQRYAGEAQRRIRVEPRTDPLERAAIDEAKARFNISDVALRYAPGGRLKRAGREHATLCLFHKERSPSMRLNDALGIFYCFGCGKSGDIVDIVQHFEGLDFLGAMEWLGLAKLPPVDPAKRAQAAEDDRVARLENIAQAQAFWRDGVSIDDTPAEVYLAARGIHSVPAAFRFAMVPSWRDPETGEWGKPRPCLMGACQNGAAEVVGIQRIFFRKDDPTLGKAACKLSLGQVRGGAIRLGPHAPRLTITEGPEDGLSIWQDNPARPVWVALGTSMMPFIELPPDVTEVIIAGQNDEPGRVAAAAAGEGLAARGLSVGFAWPDARFKDWNDWTRGIAAK